MSCGCSKNKPTLYEWTDGKNTVVYTSLLAAKAKVHRKGGSYKPVEG